MAEAEELVAEGALLATRFAQELWRRQAGPSHVALLRDVRERLECFVVGLRGACPVLAVANPPAQRSLFGRLALRIPGHLNVTAPLPGTDGRRVLLPRQIPQDASDPSGVRRYRLFALTQLARLEREAPVRAPRDPLERALFDAMDGSIVLSALAAELPCLRSDIASSVERSIAARPAPKALSELERAVEGVVQDRLRALLLPPLQRLVEVDRPLEEWARDTAATLKSTFAGRYRGLPGVECWGELVLDQRQAAELLSAAGSEEKSAPNVAQLSRSPRPRNAPSDEDDRRPGMFIIKPDASQQSVEDPLGLVRPLDQGQVDSAELSDALSELSEARMVRSPGVVREILLSEDSAMARVTHASPVSVNGQRFAYPEWDYKSAAYRHDFVAVRELDAPAGEPTWAGGVLRRHARLVDTVCASFAHLRPSRSRLRRQTDGSEIDIDACVTAFADRRAGSFTDDGLYEDVRPRRRDLAILVLVDSSASTDASIRGRERIIDVEKEALLLVCKAMEQLGDRYAAYGFSGESAKNVRVLPLKRFDEPCDARVEARIAGLEPDRYTRLGAAIRHATLLLAREQARHRLLLLVSDGKPNDSDEYEGRYGVEDTRQAIVEARLQNLQPFCLTVDREAPSYARHVFGPTGYTVLREAQFLPRVLLEVLRGLVTR